MDRSLLEQVFDFTGVKIALIKGNQVLVSLRDDLPTIPYPNTWDLPGGGREGAETPFDCVAREVWEELGLTLTPDQIIWGKVYPSMLETGKQSVFLVGNISQAELDSIRFGDEGQGWKMMDLQEFVTDESIIPPLRQRVRDYLEEKKIGIVERGR